MNKIGKAKKLLFTLTLLAIIVVATVFALDIEGKNGGIASQRVALNKDVYFGKYTFEQEMTLYNGEKAYFYESGDQDFRYAHDANGYILVRNNENATLEYAVNQNGRPVASGVSFLSSAKAVKNLPKMVLSDVDLDLNPDLLTDYEYDDAEVIETKPLLATNGGNITNLVIFICFADELYTPQEETLKYFGSQTQSLKNYFQVASNNTVTINSVMPGSNSVYVYKDSEKRSYYNTDGNDRARKEASLLTNAVAAAKAQFNIPGSTNLDVNDDGYIDCMSFLISSFSSETWGSLLWPHSWNLDGIDGLDSYSEINGVKVGEYSFNFAGSLNLGVLCHETSHVLGAPDLYHYDEDFVPVGKWDLMSTNQSVPQYMLTYTRDKYIGGIQSNQIQTISGNGVYSLAPTSSAIDATQVLAYKIPVAGSSEYFMVEYRRVTESGYDSMLPGSGLIVYRIKEPDSFEDSTGNMDAEYKGTGSAADEVFVFRPQVHSTIYDKGSVLYANSKKDVDYGYLSPNNQYFSKIGTQNVTKAYSSENLYLTNGSNSGVIIETLSMSATSIEFSVKKGGAQVNDNYFKDKITLNDVAIWNTAEFAGVTATVNIGSITPEYLSTIEVELIDASGNLVSQNTLNLGKFLPAYKDGERSFKADFVYADKGNVFESLFDNGGFVSDEEPIKAVLKVVDADGDEVTITENTVQDPSNHGWDTIISAKTELKASIEASTRMTVGVKRDGTVDASGFSEAGQWAVAELEAITAVALGYTHTLALRKNLTVVALGNDSYGETAVSSWTDVMMVAAGSYTSYGLKTDGSVVAVGLNDKGQLQAKEWTNIEYISANAKRVAGVTKDGKVVACGNVNAYEIEALSAMSNVIQVACGNDFIACLDGLGQVTIVGNLPGGDVSSWAGIEKIDAGTHHLLALDANGNVYATGDNSYGQCATANLYDIVDIAGGEYHSAFLREDGVVEYRGTGNAQYGTNQGVDNLIYSNYVSVNSLVSVGISNNVLKIAKGETFNFEVSYLPSNATYKRMKYSVADSLVAEVEATDRTLGTVIALSVGSTTCTVTEHGSGKTLTFTIEVYENIAITGIAFSEAERSVVIGATSYLTLNILPQGAVTTATPAFSSDNANVTVDSEGAVKVLDSATVGETATITATLGSFSASCIIKAVATLLEISVNVKSDANYRYGAELDFSRYELIVSLEGKTETIALTDEMVTGYNSTLINTVQTIYVSYMGASAEFKVVVKDYVVDIGLSETPQSKYLYGEELVASGSYVINYASGAVVGPNLMNPAGFKGYKKTAVGMQTINFVYVDQNWDKEFSIEHQVTVVDYVNKIAFVPLKNNYGYGEAINKTELVDLYMMSGAIRQTELGACDVRDEHTEVDDKTSPLYSLYSVREGVHNVIISYTDPDSQETKSCNVVVSVYVDGEYHLIGKDADTSYYYYEVGKKLYCGLNIVQENATVEVTDDTTGNIWYEVLSSDGVTPFSAVQEGEAKAIIKVFVERQTINGNSVSVSAIEIWSMTLDVYGLPKTTSVAIAEGSVNRYQFGSIINSDSENLDIALTITYENGTTKTIAPMELDYTTNELGTHTLRARYLYTWVEYVISVEDFVTAINEIEDITIEWGEDIAYQVTAATASGAERALETTEYLVSAYDISKVGTQTITIVYLKDTNITTTFNVTVLDKFSNIRVDVAPKTKYKKGDRFDPTSTYVITYVSGRTESIAYNDTDFYYDPAFNSNNAPSSQMISIYYVGRGTPIKVWSGNCYVPNYVTLLEVVRAYTKYEYSYGEPISVMIKASYADGSATTLSSSSYTTNYVPTKIGTQTVTVSYVYDGDVYTASFVVTVSDTVLSLTLSSLPNVVSYGYGDAINWTGAKVVVTYASAQTVTYVDNEITRLNVNYTTTISGTQRVTISAGSFVAYFNIAVGKESLAIVGRSTDNVKINVENRKIALTESVTVGDLYRLITCASYLTARYDSRVYGEIDVLSSLDKRVATGDKYQLVNASGKAVVELVVYLKGDGNGDGMVDHNDLQAHLDSVASGSQVKEVLDYNGDGKANLTDLVKWARKTSGAEPKQAPLNDTAKKMIINVRPRSKEEENA